jgi:hypothetical protein
VVIGAGTGRKIHVRPRGSGENTLLTFVNKTVNLGEKRARDGKRSSQWGITIAMSGGMPGVGSEGWQSVAKNVGVTATLAKTFTMSDLRLTVAQTLKATP